MSSSATSEGLPSLGFFGYGRLAFTSNPRQSGSSVEKNWREVIGDVLVSPLYVLPGKIYGIVTDPRVVTIALGAIAMVGVSFAFYPVITYAVGEAALATLAAYLPVGSFKFISYITCETVIAGMVLRTLGRMGNAALLREFAGARV